MRKAFVNRKVECLDCPWRWVLPCSPPRRPDADLAAGRQHSMRKGHAVLVTTREIYSGKKER